MSGKLLLALVFFHGEYPLCEFLHRHFVVHPYVTFESFIPVEPIPGQVQQLTTLTNSVYSSSSDLSRKKVTFSLLATQTVPRNIRGCLSSAKFCDKCLKREGTEDHEIKETQLVRIKNIAGTAVAHQSF